MRWTHKIWEEMKRSRMNAMDSDGDMNPPPSSPSIPEYVIKADNIFKSEISGFEDYAECVYFSGGMLAPSSSTISSYYSGSNGIQSADERIGINITIGMVDILSAFSRGDLIKKIIIKKLASNSGDVLEVIAFEYSDCFVKTFENIKNSVFFTFSFCSLIVAQNIYDVSGKKKQGTAAVEINNRKLLTDTSPEKLPITSD